MKFYIIQSNEPVEGTYMRRTLQADQHVPRLVALWDRDLLEWHISSSGENRAMYEHHQDMLRYHGGNKVFWWDGGVNAIVDQRRFLGYGDGVNTDFFLPDRWVYPDSLVMSQNYTTTTTWTLTESTGMVRWTSAPANGVLIHAEKYVRRFKGYFAIESDKLYMMKDNFKSFESNDIMIREFPY